jgi:hypothetical protein
MDGVVLIYVAHRLALARGLSPADSVATLGGPSASMLLGMLTTAATSQTPTVRHGCFAHHRAGYAPGDRTQHGGVRLLTLVLMPPCCRRAGQRTDQGVDLAVAHLL